MLDPSALPATGYPPAPWILEGPVLLGQVKALRPMATPNGVRPIFGRRIMLLLARYRTGTLAYSELALCSYTRRGLRAGLAIRHIWVDSEVSVLGGTHIWGLPKKLAIFEWSDDRVRVSDVEGPIATLNWSAAGRRLPRLTVPVPFFGLRDRALLYTVAIAQVRIAATSLTVTEWSTRLPAISRPRPRLAVVCDPSRVTVPAAHVLAGSFS